MRDEGRRFLRQCGGNISGVIDLEPLAEHARDLDGVVEVDINQFMCGTEGRAMIEKAVEERGLDHFVIASCSPRFQGPTFERIAASSSWVRTPWRSATSARAALRPRR